MICQVNRMIAPSFEFIHQLFIDYAVPAPIYDHCRIVQKVGRLIGERLQNGGVVLDLDGLEKTCLIHDTFKVVSLPDLDPRPALDYPGATEDELKAWNYLKRKYAGMHETQVAAEILREEYPEFAGQVERLGQIDSGNLLQQPLELQIVYYADRRVVYTRIVSLRERLDYITSKINCGKNRDSMGEGDRESHPLFQLETIIFQHVPFPPSELERRVREYPGEPV
jgi:hypothetical protein